MASELRSPAEQAAEVARGSYSNGCNCAESVLDSVAAALDLGDDALARSSGYAWTGGIDESGCLCGALSAAVSLAGQVAAADGGTVAQQRLLARQLADELRRTFIVRWRGTCCRIVRDGREFGTPECAANCEEVTAFTTQLAIDVLANRREPRSLATPPIRRVAATVGTGALLGLEAAWLVAVLGGEAVGAGALLGVGALPVLAGASWGALAAARTDARRALARPGRMLAAAAIALAALVALAGVLAPSVATAANARVASALGASALAPLLGVLWVLVPVAWASPAVFNLARRRGAR